MEVSTTMKNQTIYTRSSVYNLLNNKFNRVNHFEKADKEQTAQNNWFKSRGLRVLNYQTDAINKVKNSLNKQEVTVLAACPSAGKTITAIYIIEDYLKRNPTHKVLVLAHGTTVLRSQFYDNFESMYSTIKSNFECKLVQRVCDYDNRASINICLPQTLKGRDLSNIDLLVVDEAHQFFFARMVKDIIKKIKPKKQLLLTGTPSIFIRHKYPIIPITLNTVFDEGMASDLLVEIATSSYNFNVEDFNRGELRSCVNFRDSETKKTLDNLIGKIVERLQNISVENVPSSIVPEWLPTLQKLHKTMFVCKSQVQARQVQWYFDNIQVKSALSISDSDKDSSGIENFKKDEKCLVLIVVGRGILGFNYPELVNVVDMTTSQNIDRIYQLMCRVIRKHPEGERKLFFKIAPTELAEYYKYLMTAVLALTDESFYTKFDGKNSDELKIPVEKCLDGVSGKNPKKTSKKFKPIEFKDLPAIELFKLIMQNNDSLLSTYAMASMLDVRSEFFKKKNGYWTKEKCIDSSMNYNRFSQWIKFESGAYQSARKNGWLVECTKHMLMSQRPKGYWTLEKCKESALRYNSIQEWQKNGGTAYNSARKNGWLEECTKHITRRKPIGYWTLEKCKESGLRYTSITEWTFNESNGYDSARKNGWLEECTKHMIRSQKPKGYWTLEKCKESALRYNSIQEWQKNGGTAYNSARKNGWLEECTEHMIRSERPKGYWTMEKCKESGLRYTSITKWQKNEKGAFKSARKNGWLEECTKHMIRTRKEMD